MPSCFRRRATWLLPCALALTLGTGRGGAAEPAEELKAIRSTLERIDARMAAQQSQMTDTMVLVNKLMSDLTTMKDEHSRLKQELADQRNRPVNQASTSYYAGPAGASAPAPGPMPSAARVKLVNTYFMDMTAVIDGVTYTLRPGAEWTIPHAPGTLTYQVFMVADLPQTRTLVPGEQLTLTLYPRR